jgi:hypothetical protein
MNDVLQKGGCLHQQEACCQVLPGGYDRKQRGARTLKTAWRSSSSDVMKLVELPMLPADATAQQEQVTFAQCIPVVELYHTHPCQ